jgi:hypothetical protein
VAGGGTQGSARSRTRLDGPSFMTDTDYAAPANRAAIFCGSPFRTVQLTQLAEQCGCRIYPLGDPVDYLLLDLSSDSDLAGADWTEIDGYLCGNATEILVWAALEGVDAAFAALPPVRCHFFVDAADWQSVPILSGAVRLVKAQRFGDSARDNGQGELDALHRISSELADFARTLAMIAEQDKSAGSTVNDRPVGFRHAPPDALKPIFEKPFRNATVHARHIREIIKLRRMRERLLGEDLFADPGWDILLDLFAARGSEAGLGFKPVHRRRRPTDHGIALDHRDDRGRPAGPTSRTRMTHGGFYRTVRRQRSQPDCLFLTSIAGGFDADMTCRGAALWQRRRRGYFVLWGA